MESPNKQEKTEEVQEQTIPSQTEEEVKEEKPVQQKQRKVIATRGGRIIADQVVAAALLHYFVDEYKECKVIKTDDQEQLDKADLLFDVGGEYNHEERKYDHNQDNFKVKYFLQNAAIMCSSTLIYVNYSQEIINNMLEEINNTFNIKDKLKYQDEQFQIRIKNRLYKNFFHFLDATDNGITAGFLPKYEIKTTFDQQIAQLNSFTPFKTDPVANLHKGIQMAKQELLEQVKSILEGFYYFYLCEEAIKSRHKAHPSRRLIYFNQNMYHLEISSAIRNIERTQKISPLILFIVINQTNFYQKEKFSLYCVQNKDVNGRLYHRVKLSQQWAGLDGKALQDQTGWPDCIFCHQKRFMLSAKSKETCYKAANWVLDRLESGEIQKELQGSRMGVQFKKEDNKVLTVISEDGDEEGEIISAPLEQQQTKQQKAEQQQNTAEVKPEQTKTQETKTQETKTVESKTEETKTVESKTEETKTVESKTVESKTEEKQDVQK